MITIPVSDTVVLDGESITVTGNITLDYKLRIQNSSIPNNGHYDAILLTGSSEDSYIIGSEKLEYHLHILSIRDEVFSDDLIILSNEQYAYNITQFSDSIPALEIKFKFYNAYMPITEVLNEQTITIILPNYKPLNEDSLYYEYDASSRALVFQYDNDMGKVHSGSVMYNETSYELTPSNTLTTAVRIYDTSNNDISVDNSSGYVEILVSDILGDEYEDTTLTYYMEVSQTSNEAEPNNGETTYSVVRGCIFDIPAYPSIKGKVKIDDMWKPILKMYIKDTSGIFHEMKSIKGT